MTRTSAAKPRAPPKKAKYANAYKVAFEADFPWVGKSSLWTNQAFCRSCNGHFSIASVHLGNLLWLLNVHYYLVVVIKNWLTVSVIHRLWSNEECTNGGLAATPTATNFFCLLPWTWPLEFHPHPWYRYLVLSALLKCKLNENTIMYRVRSLWVHTAAGACRVQVIRLVH